MSKRRDGKEKRGRCTRNAVFHNRNDAGESKMMRERLCFRIEMAAAGRAGRRCQTAVAAMVTIPGGAGLPIVVLCHWGMQLQIGRRFVMVGSRWQWVADGGAV